MSGDRNFSHCRVCGQLFENENERWTECLAHRPQLKAKRTSKRKRWSVTVTIDGRDRGSWRSVETVEPWTAIYHVLKYGITDRSLTAIEGMTITVKPDPVPPEVRS